MKAKTIAAAEFKATRLRLIDEMNESGESITITKRGRPVAVLTPVRFWDIQDKTRAFGAGDCGRKRKAARWFSQ
ncbi:type II toxin-antitoxin system Phd/YefM family antitoxin [Neorhizobium vignae]|uniref:type II toxin-antitoxin system Phd/YefM family antitoxin n=1 Tax=Neorhizobium vignae TaxID=690585 RepID=UPI00068CAFAA|nr:type II toxin-antitoxin system Phd/YefM family antitoxin [Neorhizobium vignae]